MKLWLDDVRPAPEYVICKECTMWEECENKEKLDGCYFGEKEPDDDVSDEEYETAAQEAHDNLVRSLVEAGGTVREARELLTRSLEQLYLLGYDSAFTNSEIAALVSDIKKFLEDTE